MRARIDVSEIEATTKIRAKYLRALENEEWGLLPGPTFVKSFLRTYAQALGLDGKALVEEYRESEELGGEAMHDSIVASSRRPRARGMGGAGGGGPSRGYVIAVGAFGAIIVLLIVLIAANAGSGGGHPARTSSSTHRRTGRARGGSGAAGRAGASNALVSLSLRPTALVYVCLIGEGGHVLLPGIELRPPESTPTYRARRFEITLGNSSVVMVIDGTPRTVEPSSQAIGYSITKATGRQALAPGHLPTCAS